MTNQPLDHLDPLTPSGRLSIPNRIVYIALLALGAVWVGFRLVETVIRLVEVIPNRDVRIPVPFIDMAVPVPIGTDGTSLPVQISDGLLTVPSLEPAGYVILLLQILVGIAAVVVVAGSAALVGLSILRAQFFSRRNTILVTIAALVALFGWAVEPFFMTMVSDVAINAVSDPGYDSPGFPTRDLGSQLLAVFIAGTVPTVFALGDKLRRDTVGLV
jgi:hypothetical protein